MSLSMVLPDDNQAGNSYNSNYVFHRYGGYPAPPTQPVRFAYSSAPPAGVQCRNRVYDHAGVAVYIGPWHAPDASRSLEQFDLWALVNGRAGEYLCSPEEFLPSGQPVYDAAVRILTPSAPGPTSHLWVSSNSVDAVYRLAAPGSARIVPPASTDWPVTDPAPARAVQPYATVKTGRDLWNTRRTNQQLKSAHRIFESLVRVSAADRLPTLTMRADYMKYFSAGGPGAVPHVSLADGPRNVAHRGWTMDCRIWPGATGDYGLDWEGRLWGMTASGELTTEVGYRTRPDVYSPDYGLTTIAPAWMLAHYERIGDFSALEPASGTDPAPNRLNWQGFAVQWGATRAEDEFFICDGARHAILHVSARPRRVRVLAANADWSPGLLNKPKACDVAPDGTLVVLNMGNNTLVTVDPVTGAITPGVALAPLLTADRVRHFSDGRLAVSQRVPGELWEVDKVTGPVRRIATMTANTTFNSKNWVIAVDTRGECGPVDDIFTAHPGPGAERRWGREGTLRPTFFPVPGRRYEFCLEGRHDVVMGPVYVEALDVAHGAIAVHGMGSETSQWITASRPDDPDPDLVAYEAGLRVWRYATVTLPDTGNRCALPTVYGQHGNGTLGGQYANGSWAALARLSDAGIIAWGVAHGLPVAEATKLIYPIRWEHPGAPPPGDDDTEAPETPTAITATAAWEDH